MKRHIFAALAACALVACVNSDDDSDAETANAAAVEKAYGDFAAGDVGAVLGAMSDGIVWNEAEHFPYADGNPYIGPQAVAEGVFARLGSEWNYWTLDIEDISPSGDTVFVRGRYNAQNKETGKIMSAQFVHVWTVSDGKFVRFQQYADTALVNSVMTAD